MLLALVVVERRRQPFARQDPRPRRERPVVYRRGRPPRDEADRLRMARCLIAGCGAIVLARRASQHAWDEHDRALSPEAVEQCFALDPAAEWGTSAASSTCDCGAAKSPRAVSCDDCRAIDRRVKAVELAEASLGQVESDDE